MDFLLTNATVRIGVYSGLTQDYRAYSAKMAALGLQTNEPD